MNCLRVISIAQRARCVTLWRHSGLENVSRRSLVTSAFSDQPKQRECGAVQRSDGPLLNPRYCVIQSVRTAWFTKGLKGPRMPPQKHLDFDHSGDMEQQLPPLDLTSPKVGYEECEELKTADDDVKKVVSLHFASGQDRKAYHMKNFLSKTQKHPGDYTSIEAKITRLTVKIRTQINYCLQFRKDSLAKTRLNNNIQTRKKLLKNLRVHNFDKFTKLCDELRIVYIPVPEIPPPKTQRAKRVQSATEESEAIRKAKMKALEEDLEKQREEFYKEKEQIIAAIEEDLAKMGVDGQKMMEDILSAERKEELWKNSKLYKFLQRFPRVDNKYITMKIQQ